MNDILVIAAISVIVIGSLLLAGLAIWLALDRSRHAPAGRSQANRQAETPSAKAAQPISGAPPVGQPFRPGPPPPAPVEPKQSVQQQDPAHPAAANSAPGAASSGEYPAAALYDQTILPPPKRRTRPQQ